MPGKGCKKSGRAHTPITSKKERGAMGAAYGAKKRGTTKGLREPARSIAKSMSKPELKRHLQEAKGKNLPTRAKKSSSRKK